MSGQDRTWLEMLEKLFAFCDFPGAVRDLIYESSQSFAKIALVGLAQ